MAPTQNAISANLYHQKPYSHKCFPILFLHFGESRTDREKHRGPQGFAVITRSQLHRTIPKARRRVPVEGSARCRTAGCLGPWTARTHCATALTETVNIAGGSINFHGKSLNFYQESMVFMKIDKKTNRSISMVPISLNQTDRLEL